MATPEETPTAEAATPTAGKHAAIVHNADDTLSGPDSLAKLDQEPPATYRLRITRLSNVKRRWPTFLYPERVPMGALTILGGDPGLGKSTWTMRLAALVTRGELGPAAPVMFALGEDGVEGVFHGRAEAAGGVMERLHVFDGEGDQPFTLPESVPALAEDIAKLGARLVIVDPLDNFYTRGIETGKAASLRQALKPLADMAAETGVAVIVVSHLNKDRNGSALTRFAGSLGGLVGVMRSALLFTGDPDEDGDDTGKRALGHVKSNWGRTAHTEIYQHRGVTLPDTDGSTFEVSRLEYLGDSEVRGEELVGDHSEETPAGKLERATELLAEQLEDGTWRKKGEIIKIGKVQGITPRTLERAAKTAGVQRKQKGSPAVGYWRLPTFAKQFGEPTLANLHKPHDQAESEGSTAQVRQALEGGEPADLEAEGDAAGADRQPDPPDPEQVIRVAWDGAVEQVNAAYNRLPDPDAVEVDTAELAELEAQASRTADEGNTTQALELIARWRDEQLQRFQQLTDQTGVIA